MQEPVGYVGQIVKPVAQVGIGLPLQLGSRVILHALDRGFGCKAGAHRLPQTAQPAAVVRDHAERFQHVAMLARDAVVAAVDEVVDRGAHRADRRLQPLQLRLDIVGHDLGHGHARLVHDDMAEAEAVGDAETLQRQRPPAGDRSALRRHPLQLARGDHLGEQHRRRLKRLDLLFRVGAPRAVLHHQHADRRAPAQDRHAEEGLVDLFAGLGLVGERRMMLGVGERQRFGARGDEADEALARPHGRQMDGFAVEALGGEQLHRAVGANDIERAHLRHHIGGDEHNDAVEARLGRDGLRHDFAKPPQQQTGSARRAHSESSSLLARRYVGVSGQAMNGPSASRWSERAPGPLVLRLRGV